MTGRPARVMYHGSLTEHHGPATVVPTVGWCCAYCRAAQVTEPGLALETATGVTLRHVHRSSVTVLFPGD